jgi:hypothetical protein
MSGSKADNSGHRDPLQLKVHSITESALQIRKPPSALPLWSQVLPRRRGLGLHFRNLVSDTIGRPERSVGAKRVFDVACGPSTVLFLARSRASPNDCSLRLVEMTAASLVWTNGAAASAARIRVVRGRSLFRNTAYRKSSGEAFSCTSTFGGE